MSKSNAIIGQSGGPTSVINASLAGIVETAAKNAAIGAVLGMRYGIEGFMSENIIDFGKESQSTIKGLTSTPSSILGSCRHKLKDADLPKIFDVII
jgi:6-phosphofructokinase